MISATTLEKFQTKSLEIVTSLAHKVWEHKYHILPLLVLGFGFIKHRDSLTKESKTRSARKASKQLSEKVKTYKKQRKNHMYLSNTALQAKLQQNLTFKEEGFNLEDASTTCQSDKENTVERIPVIMGSNKKGIHSGYHSDLESVIPEDERQMMVKEALPKEITSNPDDLFFNIFQQLK